MVIVTSSANNICSTPAPDQYWPLYMCTPPIHWQYTVQTVQTVHQTGSGISHRIYLSVLIHKFQKLNKENLFVVFDANFEFWIFTSLVTVWRVFAGNRKVDTKVEIIHDISIQGEKENCCLPCGWDNIDIEHQHWNNSLCKSKLWTVKT